MEIAKTIARTSTWGLLAFAMLGAGATKLMGDPMHVTNFVDNWGYGAGFMYFTGLVELTITGLLLSSKTRFYGAALGIATMFGAFGTHLAFAEYGGLGAPIFLGGLAAITAALTVPESLNLGSPTPASQT